MKKVGVLAIQGAFKEHADILKSLGCSAVEVRRPDQLDGLDGLILPGGESTAMLKQLHDGPMFEALRNRIVEGLPVMGTCAGMVLLSKSIDGEEMKPLGVMDMTVRRNAYGRQLDSFVHTSPIPGISEGDLTQIFIRAPYITGAGANVEVLHTIDGQIVAARENKMLALSFHPELGSQRAVHEYFLQL